MRAGTLFGKDGSSVALIGSRTVTAATGMPPAFVRSERMQHGREVADGRSAAVAQKFSQYEQRCLPDLHTQRILSRARFGTSKNWIQTR